MNTIRRIEMNQEEISETSDSIHFTYKVKVNILKEPQYTCT